MSEQRTPDADHEVEADTPTMRIGVTASFTPEPIERPLTAELSGRGRSATIAFADYNQVHQTLMGLESTFVDGIDRLVVLWRVEDVFERLLVEHLDDLPTIADELDERVRELGSMVQSCAANHGVPVLVNAPMIPHLTWADTVDPVVSLPLARLHGSLVSAFVESSSHSAVKLIDLDALVRSVGVADAYDTRNHLMYRQPFSSQFLKRMGSYLADGLEAFDRPPPKVLAVDADNTLWGGIVGEDGVSGIQIGDAFPGTAFVAFQRALLDRSRRGTLLALVSKNNEADVLEVFDKRPEMVLGPKDFAAMRVNWEPKSQNLNSIADELNLGIDSFVFIDDSEFELSEVATAFPQVRCVHAPEEPSELVELVAGIDGFRFATVSDEDRKRTAMMHDEQDRKVAAQSATTPEEFLASLHLVVSIFSPTSEHLGRVTQLINKSNQFNLTTVRRSEADVTTLIDSDRHRVFVAEVDDKFGGYGIVAVAIVEIVDDVWKIDTLLMSCRVLKRGVETAVISHIARRARNDGARVVRGSYLPTAKNAMVAELYPEHHFTAVDDTDFELVLAEDSVPEPPHIDIVTDA